MFLRFFDVRLNHMAGHVRGEMKSRVASLVFQEKMKGLAQMDIGAWIALIYGSQILGILCLAPLIELGWNEIAFPIFFLIFGTVIGLWFRSRSRFYPITFWQRWLPAFIYFLFISSLSHRSFKETSVSFNVNIFHPMEYASLGFFLSWAFHPIFVRRGLVPFSFGVLCVGFACGMLDEFHQSLIPGRFPSYVDLLLDFFGLCMGWMIYQLFFRRAEPWI
jgi:VanZ family protein